MIQKFRKKPVVIEAVQFDGNNFDELLDFTDGTILINPIERVDGKIEKVPMIETLGGFLSTSVGDWIIKKVNGEFYPYKPDIFEKTYEEVIL